MLPTFDAFLCSPLPSNGSRGRHNFRGPVVPHLRRYYGLIRSLAVRHPRSLVALDRRLPLLYVAGGNCEVFPSSWRIPLKTCPGLETPAAPGVLAISATRILPSVSIKTSASAIVVNFGAESSRPTSSLSTLRHGGSPHRDARLATGLPATALVGLDFHQLDSFERFHPLTWTPPLPSFAWRDILLTL
jgi:hypothetical protein